MTVLAALTCLFAAYVSTVPAPNNLNVIPVKLGSTCYVEHSLVDGTLALLHNGTKVLIQIPQDRQWYRVRYYWGTLEAEIAKVEPWVPQEVVVVKGHPTRH